MLFPLAPFPCEPRVPLCDFCCDDYDCCFWWIPSIPLLLRPLIMVWFLIVPNDDDRVVYGRCVYIRFVVDHGFN